MSPTDKQLTYLYDLATKLHLARREFLELGNLTPQQASEKIHDMQKHLQRSPGTSTKEER